MLDSIQSRLAPEAAASELADRAQASEQFLRCHLAPDALVMLPVSQLTEVLKIPVGQITPIPHLPAWVMGVYNWRGEILWMVDLGHLLGMSPWHQQTVSTSSYTAAILSATDSSAGSAGGERRTLGLVVTQVQDIELCDPGQIQSPPPSAITPELAPFLQGYWLKADGEMLACLNGTAILAAMPNA
ncbi:MAG: chemotaxis protein CheW [Pegethrix bostrychoides GSE-TBD4-15B]|jgi:positive phototaxis protein PixI|uniref:Chemotaxis protein CheW n=1 Tax=Pegethrix bostrychoides GSE-TBD4-15B TaxID=2839662 RepID=A0A951PE16_9CYAN|nr:chemotaxis protein CheW [Pegethrix bostrychoides GSE-TBD4-15B]